MEDNIPESATNKLHTLIVSWRREFVDKMEKEMKEIENKFPKNFPRQMKLSVPKVGDTSVLENLILEGANLDVLEQREINCIPYSFWSQEIISFFLERHSRDINSCDCWGNTALILAARYSLYSVVQYLLANGADPNIRNLKGETALFVFVNEALESIQTTAIPGEDDFSDKTRKITVEMLLKSGADIESMNAEGLTLLHCKKISFKFFNDIRGNFGNMNIRCSKLNYERTPLINAAVEGDSDYIYDLIKNSKVEVNAQDMVGFTALHYAAIAEDPECYNLLTMTEKAVAAVDFNVLTNSGRSVFEFASLSGKRINDHRMKNEEPAKRIMVHELAGAIAILDKRDYRNGIEEWSIALDLRTSCNLPKLSQLTEKQKSVYGITKEYETKQELVHLLEENVSDLISTALFTLERNFQDESGFWNLLFGICKVINWQNQSSILLFLRRPNPVIMEIFTYVSENTKTLENCYYKGLLDYPNTETVRKLISFFYCNLTGKIGTLRFSFTTIRQQEIDQLYIPKWRPHVHFLAKLCSVYVRTWKNKVESKKTPCFGMLFQVCRLLAHMNHKVPYQTDLNLIWDIARQDPRDNCGNTLMHSACSHLDYELMKALMDHESAYVMSYKNVYGETPIQMGGLCIYKADIGQYVRNGAHVDLKSVFPKKTWTRISERLIFPYVSLQCLCARVLIKSEIIYKDKVPKQIVDFINSHSVPHRDVPLKISF